MSDINHFVERLEQLLKEGWRIPMSAYLVINEDEFLELLDQIRTAIPKQIRQADRIVQERERTLAEAEAEGERILLRAREDAARLADEHELVSAATLRAQTIVDRAHHEAETLKAGADEYAASVLRDLDAQLGTLEAQIGRLTGIVHRGMERLARSEETPEPEDQPK
jgi:cell division septum initiation protein DivIVA